MLARGLDQLGLGFGELALLAERDSAKLGRLRVEDRGAFGRSQVGADRRHFLARRAFAVDRQRQRRRDQPAADLLALADFGDRRHRHGQRRDRRIVIVLVELVDRAIIADQPLHHAVASRAGGFGAAEQPLGRGEIAEVRLLQPLVGEGFGQRRRLVDVAARQAFEKFGAFGEAAGIVAGIGLDARPGGIERTGLDPGEGGGIADLGRRDLHRALLRPVGDDRRQRQPQRRVVSGQPFGQVKGLAALDRIAAVIERWPLRRGR